MLTLIFFFFLVLSPKIACSVQLLYRFQGNENGAWHCGSFMQIVARLAALPGCEIAHRQMGVYQGQARRSRSLNYLTSAAFRSRPPVALMQARQKQEMDLIIPILQSGETKI